VLAAGPVEEVALEEEVVAELKLALVPDNSPR